MAGLSHAKVMEGCAPRQSNHALCPLASTLTGGWAHHGHQNGRKSWCDMCRAAIRCGAESFAGAQQGIWVGHRIRAANRGFGTRTSQDQLHMGVNQSDCGGGRSKQLEEAGPTDQMSCLP